MTLTADRIEIIRELEFMYPRIYNGYSINLSHITDQIIYFLESNPTYDVDSILLCKYGNILEWDYMEKKDLK